MKVIERYILRRVFVVFLAALFWTLAIVWTTQVLARIDLVTDSGQSALTFFEIATLILPSIIPIVVPFALVIAVAQTLSMMNTDSELVVISAAGTLAHDDHAADRCCSPWRPASSPLRSTMASTPSARERSRQLVAAARADLLSLVIQEGTFRKIDDGLFIQIGERLPDGQLGGIFVADSRTEGRRSCLLRQDRRGAADGRQEDADDERRRHPPQDADRRRLDHPLHLLCVRPVGVQQRGRSTGTMYPKDRSDPLSPQSRSERSDLQGEPAIISAPSCTGVSPNGPIRWSSP